MKYLVIFILLSTALHLKAQNLIINPSFEEYTGTEKPCTDATSYYEIDDFPGLNYRLLRSSIVCADCHYRRNHIDFGSSGFKVSSDSFLDGNHFRVLNRSENLVKNGEAKFDDVALILGCFFGYSINGKPTTPKDFEKYQPDTMNGPFGGGLIGSLVNNTNLGDKYFFSVWLSTSYSACEYIEADLVRMSRHYATSDFGFDILSKSEFDLASNFKGYTKKERNNYIESLSIEAYNPRKNIINGNADSTWVELRMVFTANEISDKYAFGFFPQNLGKFRDFTLVENPWFKTYNLIFDDLFTAQEMGFYYFADGMTLLPYPELGDTIFLTEGESILLDPKVPDANLVWYDGKAGASREIYCPGTYWVRSSSEFSSITDSVVVVFKPNSWPKDTVLCYPDAQLSIPENAYDIQWNTGDTTKHLLLNKEGYYKVQYKLNGGCELERETNVWLDTLYYRLLTDTIVCDSVVLNIKPHIGQSYFWSTGLANNRIIIKNSGNYTLTVSNKNCNKILPFSVEIEEIAQIYPADTLLCKGEKWIFNPRVPYKWHWVSEEQTLVTDSTDIIISWQQPNCGIIVDTCKVRYRNCPCTPFIPNAFSPNNDGLNDGFIPIINCELLEYNLRIYNRWGQEIYATQNPTDVWQAENTQIGAYYYLLSFRGLHYHKEQFVHGVVYVID